MEISSHALSALGGGATVGALLRAWAWFVKHKTSEDKQLRSELRDQIGHMNEEIKRLSGELDSWKEKFYRLLEDNLKLKNQVDHLSMQISVLEAKAKSV